MPAVSTGSARPFIAGAPREALLDMDADEFAAKFNREPFLIRHRLGEHPLFALPRLLELAKRLPEKDIEYNAGDIPMTIHPTLTPRNGLSAEETIRRIEECRSWMVLKYVENDPDYRDLLERCLAEIRPHSEPIAAGMMQPEGFIFISSPNSVTPYHMDPEHNFLLQIRGGKTVRQFDRGVVSEEEFERFFGGAHRNLAYKEEYVDRSWTFDLQAGSGLHFPHTFPHWVENGPSVSISFSITFRTPDLERRALAYNVNAFLRRRGLTPTPVGQSRLRDALKCLGLRMCRRTKRLFGFGA